MRASFKAREASGHPVTSSLVATTYQLCRGNPDGSRSILLRWFMGVLPSGIGDDQSSEGESEAAGAAARDADHHAVAGFTLVVVQHGVAVVDHPVQHLRLAGAA